VRNGVKGGLCSRCPGWAFLHSLIPEIAFGRIRIGVEMVAKSFHVICTGAAATHHCDSDQISLPERDGDWRLGIANSLAKLDCRILGAELVNGTCCSASGRLDVPRRGTALCHNFSRCRITSLGFCGTSIPPGSALGVHSPCQWHGVEMMFLLGKCGNPFSDAWKRGRPVRPR
jgi:hypothetical protein